MTAGIFATAISIGAVVLSIVSARAQDARPPVGGIGSLPDAMLFYVAQGKIGTCGENCGDWIAAEGTVYWDTHKRLNAILDRVGSRKYPVFLNMRGSGDFKVATYLGRVFRDRGLDVSAGRTIVDPAICETAQLCTARKRQGAALDATIDQSRVICDVVCILALAGGVHRSLPATARVVITGMEIQNRLAPAVSDEQRVALSATFFDQFRLYLKAMDVDQEVVNIIARNSDPPRSIVVPVEDWMKLRIVNVPPRL